MTLNLDRIAPAARHQSCSCALPPSRALRPRPRPLPARVQDSGGSEDLVDLDWIKNGGGGLMRRRVVPPTGGQPPQVLWQDGGQPAQVPFPDAAEVEVVDELSGEVPFPLPLRRCCYFCCF